MNSPIDNFRSLSLSEPILRALADLGYETPSPIQAQCIPLILEGHDVLGEAQTGTGKTAAFALPILQQLKLNQPQPQVLVLTPTRELALQVAESFQSYSKYLKEFHIVPIYGGQSMTVQLRQLKRGAQIIVGTPGRIIDHIKRKSLQLNQLQTLVLDEADEMLRMGFIDDIEWILEQVPEQHQTVLFSATMPAAIRKVARQHMQKAKEIHIESQTTTVETITQRYCQVAGSQKLDALTRILETEESLDAAIIFVRTKTTTVELADKLEARGYSASALNGDMTQQLRERVVEQLKRGDLDIVIATDVAARGLDVPRISHVINYDVPYDTESYVHRIGRTGRAGREGNAILLITSREIRMLKSIEKATRQKITLQALPNLASVANRRIQLFNKKILEVLKEQDLTFFTELISSLEEQSEYPAQELAAALAYLLQVDRPLQVKAERYDINSRDRDRNSDNRDTKPRKERNSERSSSKKPRSVATPSLQEGMQRYRLDVGTLHDVKPRDIVGAIANEAGINSQNIGQIDLYEDYSIIELPQDLPKGIMMALKKLRIKQHPIHLQEMQEDSHAKKPAKRRTRKP